MGHLIFIGVYIAIGIGVIKLWSRLLTHPGEEERSDLVILSLAVFFWPLAAIMTLLEVLGLVTGLDAPIAKKLIFVAVGLVGVAILVGVTAYLAEAGMI